MTDRNSIITVAPEVGSNAFLVPQQAVFRDANGGKSVFIVAPNGKGGSKAVSRPVTTSRRRGASWVVTTGLKAGDKVITQGATQQTIKPAADNVDDLRELAASAGLKGHSADRGDDLTDRSPVSADRSDEVSELRELAAQVGLKGYATNRESAPDDDATQLRALAARFGLKGFSSTERNG